VSFISPHATIVEALIAQATRRPHRAAFTVIDSERQVTVTYEELLTRSMAVAGLLRDRGMAQGDRVLLCLPTSVDFLFSCYGTLLAGGVCVPIYPPTSSGLSRWRKQTQIVTRVAQPCGAITAGDARIHMAAVLEQHGEGAFTLTPDDFKIRGSHELNPVCADDIAFIQFTSGTTSQPRGVTITHRALMNNVRALVEGMELSEDDTSVSWLPPYHDMGLVGHIFTPVEGAVHQHLMSPAHFVKKPIRWLSLISETHATQTTAPNSAYSMCARRISAMDRRRLDLGSLRWALNGAEVVSPRTLEQFSQAFSPVGFQKDAFLPVYGLAEATLAATLGPRGGPKLDSVDRLDLAHLGSARPVALDNRTACSFVAVGKAIPGLELRVADSAGVSTGERRIGEIQLRGASIMRGYFNNPQATAEVLAEDGWLRTGDLGYLAQGELYVTGRVKELIIKGGRNYLPQDFEAASLDVSGLRAGRAVAFGAENEQTGTEDIVLVAETRQRGMSDDQLLKHRLGAIAEQLTGICPDRVELVDPGSIPKTTSGKLKRTAVKAAYAKNEPLENDRPHPLADALSARLRSIADITLTRFGRLLGWQ